MRKRAVDIVFVIDASSSMRPFLDSLKVRLREFLQQFRDDGTWSLRLGLLAHNAHLDNGRWVYRNMCINGDGPENMRILYGNDDDAKTSLFTQSGDGLVDVEGFCERLDRIDCSGEKNSLLALDCAVDFPFRPLHSTCCDPARPGTTMVDSTYPMVMMFTNDKFESGVLKDVPIDRTLALLERVMGKIVKRHITLYLFAPDSTATDMISEFERTWLITPNQVDGVESDYACDRFFGRVDCCEIAHRVSRYADAWTPWDLDEWEREKGVCEKAVLGQDKWSNDCWA